jgi:calcineurin-like phosphoesterase family protein
MKGVPRLVGLLLLLISGLLVSTCAPDQPIGPAYTPDLLRIRSASDTVLFIGAGDIAGCPSGYKDEATAAILAKFPSALVFAAGDLAYENGSRAEFACYNASWGRAKSRTYPVPGNRDYNTLSARGYFDYWNGAGVDSGRAGNRARGYYAFDYGAWRIYALNSELNISAQTAWLKADLAAHPRRCQLAITHRPYYSSTRLGTVSRYKPWWEAMLRGRVELVLSGDNHVYERFAPQDAVGEETDIGVRQFLVGTGGAGLGRTPRPIDNSEKLVNTYGVFLLKLYPLKYSYQFLPASGGKSLDSGERTCR